MYCLVTRSLGYRVAPDRQFTPVVFVAPRREQTLPPPGGDGVRADTELASGLLDGEHALGA